jgi:hypothetical protein
MLPPSYRQIGAPSLREAYARACQAMAGSAPAAPGYRLFWTRGRRSMGWMDLPAGGGYAILGRHTECDAVLDDDTPLSLRHLLAMTVSLSDGVALRILDLHTAAPFYLEDGTAQRSIVACGPVAISVCDYVIGAIPAFGGAAPGALRLAAPELPRPVVRRSDAVPTSTRGPASQVTTMRPSAPITDFASRETDVAGRRPAPANDRACATVTLRRKDRAASVDLTEAEFDVGVMIGRADRCHAGGLHALLDDNISRGHILLLHHYDIFEAFDLCSTQGTYSGRQRVRRFVLPDAGATLALASKNPVTLEWQRGPSYIKKL